MPNITTNHAITYTNKVVLINNIYGCRSRVGQILVMFPRKEAPLGKNSEEQHGRKTVT